MATNDKNLKFVCEYTGLDEKTIDFFVKNKNDNGSITKKWGVVEFIEFIAKSVVERSENSER